MSSPYPAEDAHAGNGILAVQRRGRACGSPLWGSASIRSRRFLGNLRKLSAHLLNDSGGREMRQQEAGDQHRPDDCLCAVHGEIPGHTNQRKECRDNTLDRELQHLDHSYCGRADTQSNQFCPYSNAPVAEKREA
jgi:hypothetical protein